MDDRRSMAGRIACRNGCNSQNRLSVSKGAVQLERLSIGPLKILHRLTNLPGRLSPGNRPEIFTLFSFKFLAKLTESSR